MEYVKLYAKTLHSSIWEEDAETRCVWLTLLILMEPTGFVKCWGVPRLAQFANVSTQTAQKAIDKFLAPDPLGLDQPEQGARLREVPGGWLVINGPKYLLTSEREAWKEAKRKYRLKEKASKGPTSKSGPSLRERLATEEGS